MRRLGCEAAEELIMRRILLSAVAVPLSLVLATAALADSKGGHGGGSRPGHGGGSHGGGKPHQPGGKPHQPGNKPNKPGHKPPKPGGSTDRGMAHRDHVCHIGLDHCRRHGTRFAGGYCYKGRHHCHWTHRCWWDRYGCCTYWCPSAQSWYYWYETDRCFYPVSYIETATPEEEEKPEGFPAGVIQILYVTNNAPGSTTTGSPESPE
jgi:hypothetical protein